MTKVTPCATRDYGHKRAKHGAISCREKIFSAKAFRGRRKEAPFSHLSC
ncbi:hypothetical protein EDWATA_01817 [Edwardsiella tarda ATCC 23685]|uniref:Uncharacterized protein n=1 Tax=Edwardsiella tarda ATCC 23685 TaxID=500638 RepID=D4F4Z0_EDWTA|nr:hypothetical protein EDWATA_01817 [Edwardsiella tarda ATCC 23685]